ncbi:MAG: hypothetical protein GXO02_03930 [Epsilonproteobacteria bacterium]|nr:hypothetical protein [Campylobacterota bacterium]
MKKVALFTIILLFLTGGAIAKEGILLAKMQLGANNSSSSTSAQEPQKKPVDCDEQLITCGDKCQEKSGWAKIKCDKDCEKQYEKCLINQ